LFVSAQNGPHPTHIFHDKPLVTHYQLCSQHYNNGLYVGRIDHLAIKLRNQPRYESILCRKIECNCVIKVLNIVLLNPKISTSSILFCFVCNFRLKYSSKVQNMLTSKEFTLMLLLLISITFVVFNWEDSRENFFMSMRELV